MYCKRMRFFYCFLSVSFLRKQVYIIGELFPSALFQICQEDNSVYAHVKISESKAHGIFAKNRRHSIVQIQCHVT